MSLVAIALAAAAASAQPTFCQKPQNAIDRMVCASPTLTAWAKASVKLQADANAQDKDWGGSLAFDYGWPARRDDCTTPACVRTAYADWLQFLAEASHEPIRIRGAPVLQRRNHAHEWTGLQVVPLGGGWTLFAINNGVGHGGERDDYYAYAMVVAHVSAGRGQFRYDDGTGLDFERMGPAAWRVSDVGDCVLCGGPVGGTYRLPGRRKPAT